MKQDIEKVKTLLERAPSEDNPLPVPAIKKEALVTSHTTEPQSKRRKFDKTASSHSLINSDDEAAAIDDEESSAQWVSIEVMSERNPLSAF